MKFHCSYCGHGIESASDLIGTVVTCPGCNAEIPVPKFHDGPQARQSQMAKKNSIPSNAGTNWGHTLRRVFLFGLVACFVVGAATAILSLLSSAFGEIQAKILLTTLSLGAYSLTGLCCAVLADQGRFRVLGAMGIVASITGALFAILTNWEIVTGWDVLIRGRFSLLIVALAFGHAALLLMIETANSVVRVVRMVTLGIIGLVALLLLSITLNPKSVSYSWTILGVFGVLDVLGTVATPILHLATRKDQVG